MLKFIILGVIQGLTEFFPVSSSGHLVIAQAIMGITENQLAISVILHLGTVLALIVFFFKDILKLLRNLRWLGLIFIVTFITGIIGVIGKNFFEELFSCPRSVAVALIVTGIILLLTQKFQKAKREHLNIKDALILGFTQAIAIIPGISRSGATISTLLFRKIDRETAFKFSFLVAIPVVLGAAVLEIKKIDFCLSSRPSVFAAGFIFSFASGMFALWALKKIIHKAKLHYFGYYCIAVAILTFLFVR